MAEREGFEPSVPLAQYTGLAVQHLKPLSHLSARLRGRKIDKRSIIARVLSHDLSLPILIFIKNDYDTNPVKIRYAMCNNGRPNIFCLNIQ